MSGRTVVTPAMFRTLRCTAGALALLAALAGCGGGDDTGAAPVDSPPTRDPVFTVSGTISGLDGRSGSLSLVLLDRPGGSGETVSVTGDGPFQFTTRIASGEWIAFSVPFFDPPWLCMAPPSPYGSSQIWGTCDVLTDVHVAIQCGRGYNVSGRIVGASPERPARIELRSAGGPVGASVIERDASGPFVFETVFKTALLEGMPYEVVPDNANCRVTNGSGIMPASDVTDVLVECGDLQRYWRFDDETTQHLGVALRGGAAGDGIVVYQEYTRFAPGPALGMGVPTGMADRDIFANLLDPPGPNAAVYSNADGKTWWIVTEAAADGRTTSTTIETRWGVRHLGNEPPVFNLELTAIELAAFADVDGSSPCVLLNRMVRARAEFEVCVHRLITLADGTDFIAPTPIHHTNDIALLEGTTPFLSMVWTWGARVYAPARRPLLANDMFSMVTRNERRTANAFLNQDVPVRLNLGELRPGDRAVIVVRSRVQTQNRFNFESAAVAYLRDPATFDPGRKDQSVAVTEIAGLALFAPPAFPADFTPQPDLTPAPACSAAGLPRAVLQFELGGYAVNEDDPGSRVVGVTRSGSSVGDVSARLRATAGTAQAGTDFAAPEQMVYFSDGDTTARSVRVDVIDDALIEGNETLTLALDQPGGCANIGPQASTTVTVLDDDSPVTSQYTLGGTVTGLAGNGLVIENIATDPLPITAGGAFQFPRVFAAGHIYRIQVTNQPQNPRQSCTVANGEGTITNASITNVQISCTTLPDSGSLDPGFGTGGRAWSTDLSVTAYDSALAQQADGKLLMVAGSNRLVRMLPNGTPDASFGTAGDGAVVVTSGLRVAYNLEAVAVQPDGRILVAGFAPSGVSGRADILVARYDANGALDTSFAGGQGIATFDFGTWNDRVADLVLQADGSILLVGNISDASGSGATDFAVLRLRAGGQIDTSYGASGWARANVAGGYDVPWAGALTADGGLVVVGRVAASGGSSADIGIVKFTATGVPDTAFGASGTGVVRPITSAHEEARDVLVLADRKILVVGRQEPVGATKSIWLARYLPNGQLDTSFGTQGVTTMAANLDGTTLALKPDGSILVAGELLVTGATQADYGTARFTAQGQPDATFGIGGVLGLDFYGGYDVPGAMLLQPDGLLLVAGKADNGSSRGRGLVRLVP